MSSELKKLRAQVDAVDRRIVRLLNQRLTLVGKIGRWKSARKLPAYSPGRTAEIMRNLARSNRGPHSPAQLRAIYRQVIAASVALQRRQR